MAVELNYFTYWFLFAEIDLNHFIYINVITELSLYEFQKLRTQKCLCKGKITRDCYCVIHVVIFSYFTDFVFLQNPLPGILPLKSD